MDGCDTVLLQLLAVRICQPKRYPKKKEEKEKENSIQYFPCMHNRIESVTRGRQNICAWYYRLRCRCWLCVAVTHSIATARAIHWESRIFSMRMSPTLRFSATVRRPRLSVCSTKKREFIHLDGEYMLVEFSSMVNIIQRTWVTATITVSLRWW